MFDWLFPIDYKWKKKSCKKVEQTLKDKYGKEHYFKITPNYILIDGSFFWYNANLLKHESIILLEDSGGHRHSFIYDYVFEKNLLETCKRLYEGKIG